MRHMPRKWTDDDDAYPMLVVTWVALPFLVVLAFLAGYGIGTNGERVAVRERWVRLCAEDSGPEDQRHTRKYCSEVWDRYFGKGAR